MNMWFKMPFTKHTRLVLSNEGNEAIIVFCQIDYTLGDKHSQDIG